MFARSPQKFSKQARLWMSRSERGHVSWLARIYCRLIAQDQLDKLRAHIDSTPARLSSDVDDDSDDVAVGDFCCVGSLSRPHIDWFTCWALAIRADVIRFTCTLQSRSHLKFSFEMELCKQLFYRPRAERLMPLVWLEMAQKGWLTGQHHISSHPNLIRTSVAITLLKSY